MERPPLRLEYRLADELEASPLNWRTPTDEGLAAIRGAVAEVGFSGALLLNERSGKLLDGHKRKRVLAGQIVPVLIGSWDEATERKILLYHDQLGGFSGFDSAKFEDLLTSPGVSTDCPELAQMLDSWTDELGLLADDEPDADALADDGPKTSAAAPDADDEVEPLDQVPDAIFPSDNPWDVPTLDIRYQADYFDFPLSVWGSIARRKMRGICCFYTDDRRFDAVFRRPNSVLLSPCPTIIEPNYSTHPQIPKAVELYGIYRKRWLGRYWQSKGRRLFVDLNVDPTTRELNFLGVPRGWRAYFSRSHGDLAKLLQEWEAAAAHAGTDDLVYGVYGGGKAVETLCRERNWVWFAEHNQVVRESA